MQERPPTSPSSPHLVTWRLDALAASIGVAGVIFAWRARFVQDDAFISFVYARALAAGDGLTWFGEPVEGYTNFLWVLWIALGMRIGAEPILWSWVGGVGALIAAVYATWKLALILLGDASAALLAIGLLVGHYSFVAFATGGLESMLQTALLTCAMLQAVRLYRGAGDGVARAAFSLSCAAAVLTRIDSALPAAIMALFVFQALHGRQAPVRAYAQLTLPAVTIVGAWIAWKLAYYGSALPNTFYAKVGVTAPGLRNGALYLWRYLHWYCLWPVLALGAASLAFRAVRGSEGAPRLRSALRDFGLLVTVIVAWSTYLLVIGGDFMEFRLLIPIAPFLFILIAFLVSTAASYRRRDARWVWIVVVVVLLAASARHANRFRGVTQDKSLDSVHALATFYGLYPDGDWGFIGRALKRELAGVDVKLALHPAGAIPFYSEIPSIDQYGLNDATIARYGNTAPETYARPGHRRHTTLRYLREQGANFVLAHPTLIVPGTLAATPFLSDWVRHAVSFNREPIGQATVVAIPIDASRALLAWYLTPTPNLDRLIQANRWEFSVVRVH